MKAITFVCIVLLISSFAVAKVPATKSRRLGIPAWAKNAIKGAANAIIGTIIDCIAEEIKRLGTGFLNKIPGLKQVGGKLIGAGIDKLKNMLKAKVQGALDAAISKLRRRRRAFGINFKKIGKGIAHVAKKAGGAVKNAAKGVANAAKAAAAGAAQFAKEGAAVVGKAANAVQKVAKKLDGLTGGKLSAALKALVCPALAQALNMALTAALKAIGWPGQAPACLIKAVENGCAAAVQAAFKRYRMLRNLRRLAKYVKAMPTF